MGGTDKFCTIVYMIPLHDTRQLNTPCTPMFDLTGNGKTVLDNSVIALGNDLQTQHTNDLQTPGSEYVLQPLLVESGDPSISCCATRTRTSKEDMNFAPPESPEPLDESKDTVKKQLLPQMQM